MTDDHDSAEPTAEDLAARFTTPEQLQHADRLATVGRLAASIIHELGTPLNVVKVRAQMIAQGEVEGDEARESAEGISQQVDRISRIIRQLLDYARASRSDDEPFDLEELCRTTATILGPVALKSKAQVAAETLSEGPFTLVGSLGAIQQVLVNLVTNALQAMTQGGSVTIGLERVEATPPGAASPRTCLRVSVRDDGPGIPEAVRSRIFEPFFTTKAAGMGTGLGLSVCAEIVADHEGWLALDPPETPGTCVRVYLPVA